MSEKTIFQKIIDEDIPADKIWEDENTFVFLDAFPVAPGHTLVIPKKPYKNIYEMPEKEAGVWFESVTKFAKILKKVTNADGINIVMNNDESAGQVVFHAHIHIIPRFENDGGYEGKKYEYKEGEKEGLIKKVKDSL